jgi:hypothetical protein
MIRGRLESLSMPDSAPELAEELTAIRKQLALLGQQLSALAQEHKALADIVNQSMARRPEGKGPGHPLGAPAQEVLARCGQDILRVLQEVGRPLTTLEILEELVHRHLSWRESTVSHTLAELSAQGLIRESGDSGPRRHVLAAPRAQ